MSTLLQLREEVRETVMERTRDTGLIPSDTRLNAWITRANEYIWSIGVARNPAAWIVRSAAGLPCTSAGVAFSAIAAAGVFRVEACTRLDSDGKYKFLRPIEEQAGHLVPDEEQASSTDPTYRWYVEGNVVYLTPSPGQTETLKFKYVGVPAALSGDNDQPLAGRYPEHHGLVAIRAAQLLYRRDEEKETPWDRGVKEGIEAFTRALQRSQGHTTRRIVSRRAYP